MLNQGSSGEGLGIGESKMMITEYCDGTRGRGIGGDQMADYGQVNKLNTGLNP